MILSVELETLIMNVQEEPFTFEQINRNRCSAGLTPYNAKEMLVLLSMMKRRYLLHTFYKQEDGHLTTVYRILNLEDGANGTTKRNRLFSSTV